MYYTLCCVTSIANHRSNICYFKTGNKIKELEDVVARGKVFVARVNNLLYLDVYVQNTSKFITKL